MSKLQLIIVHLELMDYTFLLNRYVLFLFWPDPPVPEDSFLWEVLLRVLPSVGVASPKDQDLVAHSDEFAAVESVGMLSTTTTTKKPVLS